MRGRPWTIALAVAAILIGAARGNAAAHRSEPARSCGVADLTGGAHLSRIAVDAVAVRVAGFQTVTEYAVRTFTPAFVVITDYAVFNAAPKLLAYPATA